MRGALQSPPQPPHLQCILAQVLGCAVEARGKTVAMSGQTQCEQLFTGTLLVLKINTNYSCLADHTPPKRCYGPDPASPAGSAVLWGVLKNIKT